MFLSGPVILSQLFFFLYAFCLVIVVVVLFCDCIFVAVCSLPAPPAFSAGAGAGAVVVKLTWVSPSVPHTHTLLGFIQRMLLLLSVAPHFFSYLYRPRRWCARVRRHNG